VWVSAVIARLVSLQITASNRWQDWAVRQHLSEVMVASERGPIYDRNDKLLAVSVPAGSIYVRPKQIKDKDQVAQTLATTLKLPVKTVRAKLDSTKPFVWIERQLPRPLADKVDGMKLTGVGLVVESKRFYPYNHAASTLIGRVGVDGFGLSGIEGAFDKKLQGEHRRLELRRDAYGNFIDLSPEGGAIELPRGEPLRLTIDAALQTIVDEELMEGREKANAKHAMAVMLDAETGEILAMSQAPGVNFNSKLQGSGGDLKNLILETVFEPGSIMKPIVAAAAIDAGVARATELVDCENGRLRFGPHTIKDVHPSGVISIHDVVVRSSNIGMTKIGVKLGEERLYRALRNFGFGELSGLGLSGESAGILRPISAWAKVDVATHSFGQGIAVTPLQMVRAVSAIANGGRLPSLHLIADNSEVTLRRVLSESAAREGRDMMYGVVEDEHGTGSNAVIRGVRVGGKTGTAQKARANGRGYEPGSYIASFVGFADGGAIGVNRVLSLIVAVDEPRTTSIYGGTLAAPVFQRIMQRSLHVLSTRQDIKPREGGPFRGGARLSHASWEPR
jgi:cell division protein FtsI (penicillin-binding protein 3)